MTINDKIRDKKLQYAINSDTAKISALSSGKINKYEYLTDEKILPSDQRRVIKQGKYTYSPLGEVLEKQTKTIIDQGKKQTKAIEDHEKELVESNRLIKKDISIDRGSIPLEEQKNYLINLLTLIIWLISTTLKEELKKISVFIKIQENYLKV